MTKGASDSISWVRPQTAKYVNIVWEMSRNPKRYSAYDYINVVLNHLENNHWLVSKKRLYFCMRDYYKRLGKDVLEIIPRTFYLASKLEGVGDKTDADETKLFLDYNRGLAGTNESKSYLLP